MLYMKLLDKGLNKFFFSYNFLGECMKKILLLFILLIPIKVDAISASSYVVIDMDSNNVLYSYNSDEKRLIASISKIMTCIVAIENTDINKEVVVGDEIFAAVGSNIYIEKGEKLTISDLLYGLMLRSGNDAALSIAKNVSGSIDDFVVLMNQYAKKIGMTNTIFSNPSGLENKEGLGNISTSYDMALLTSYAMKNSTYKKIVSTKNKTVKSNLKSYSWINKNKLLSHDFITGGKTGFTKKARRTLVSTASKDNMNIVIVTLNDPDDFDDHLDLYQKVFNDYQSYFILNKKNFEVANVYYPSDTLYIKNNYKLTLKKGANIIEDVKLLKIHNYDNNDVVGYVSVKVDDKEVHRESVYVKKIIKKKWYQKLLNYFK